MKQSFLFFLSFISLTNIPSGSKTNEPSVSTRCKATGIGTVAAILFNEWNKRKETSSFVEKTSGRIGERITGDYISDIISELFPNVENIGKNAMNSFGFTGRFITKIMPKIKSITKEIKKTGKKALSLVGALSTLSFIIKKQIKEEVVSKVVNKQDFFQDKEKIKIFINIALMVAIEEHALSPIENKILDEIGSFEENVKEASSLTDEEKSERKDKNSSIKKFFDDSLKCLESLKKIVF
jgi:hypothetical protein